MNPPSAGSGSSDDYYANPSYSYTSETKNDYKDINVAYSAWYLAYQRIPQDNAQGRRKGASLYAMQGFRCAIQMRDFPAARRYWALALSANPESTAAYAQLALQILFQVYYKSGKNDSGPDYLNQPQDIRSAVWNAAGRPYSGKSGKLLSMAQVENAAQAGTLDKILSKQLSPLTFRYCPVFYPDFDPISIANAYDRSFYIRGYKLRYAAERAGREAGGTGK